jgi:hypothetical protein
VQTSIVGAIGFRERAVDPPGDVPTGGGSHSTEKEIALVPVEAVDEDGSEAACFPPQDAANAKTQIATIVRNRGESKEEP